MLHYVLIFLKVVLKDYQSYPNIVQEKLFSILYSFSIFHNSKPNYVIKILDLKKKKSQDHGILVGTNDISGRYYLGIITITIIIVY